MHEKFAGVLMESEVAFSFQTPALIAHKNDNKVGTAQQNTVLLSIYFFAQQTWPTTKEAAASLSLQQREKTAFLSGIESDSLKTLRVCRLHFVTEGE